MLTYSLNKQIDSQKLLENIQNLINKSDPTKDRIMIIQIKNIDQESRAHILKLEHKNLDP